MPSQGEGGGDQGGEVTGAGGSAPVSCKIASDCALGHQCLNQLCVPEMACRNSRDCETDLVCSTEGRCVECVQDIECDPGLTCIGNTCRPPCASDRDCRDQMMLCDRTRGRCVECIVQEDCPTDRLCADGTCITEILGAGGAGNSGGAGGSSNGGRDGAGGGPASGGESNPTDGGTTGEGGQGVAGTSAEVGGTNPEAGGTAGTGAGGDTLLGGAAGNSGGTPPEIGGIGDAGQTSLGGASGVGGSGETGGAITDWGCGNGALDYGETCDDGNTADSDCCSSTCQVEPSCTCSPLLLTANSVAFPATYRDFREGDDFEPGVTGSTSPTLELVAPTLDAEQKPVFTGSAGDGFITSADTFNTWYRDVPGTNETLAGSFTLFRSDTGGYANRYKDTGEQWMYTDELAAPFCGSVGYEALDEQGNPIPCTFCVLVDEDDTECTRQETECDTVPIDRCILEGNTYKGVTDTYYDGNPAFFPVDSVTFTPSTERYFATIPPAYGSMWDDEPGTPEHNFHFTSEIRFAFMFTGAETFELAGDDDVWMFIDGKLAIDLGGIHTPVASRLVLDSTGTGTLTIWETDPESSASTITGEVALGLVPGNVYNVIIFQAERQTNASTFRLYMDQVAFGPTSCSAM